MQLLVPKVVFPCFNMVFSYNWLQSFFQKRLPKAEKLAEVLTMHSFEVSEVKKVDTDFVLDIDVLPNRGPDCFSHFGIAREISAITNLTWAAGRWRGGVVGRWRQGGEKVKLIEDKKNRAKDFVSVEVKNQSACLRYTARAVVDIKVGSSPKRIQKRLKVCGLRPINNIVDIANYVMLETGQPLHAFDGEKLEGPEGKKIIVRFAKKGEKIVTLDGEKYDLDQDILVIADSRDPLAIAGIKGGEKAEIDKNTKIVVLESANFNPPVIRRGSKKLNLRTDASLRFEHGIDPNLTETAINRATFLIQKLAGGKVARGIVDIYPKKVFPKRIKLDLDYVEKLLGVKIPPKEIIRILKSLNFKIIQHLKSNIQYLIVEVPTFRLDISMPEDLIEEIGRLYGYEKIPTTFPVASLIPSKRNEEIFWEDITKNILKEAGFIEVYNYSFINEEDEKLFGFRKSDLIEVENPVSLEQKYLRPSLIPNLLKNVQTNQKIFQDIKIFELGKIFKIENSKLKMANYKEKKMLSGLMTGDSFYQVKGVIDLLLNKLGISNIWYDSYQPTPEDYNPPSPPTKSMNSNAFKEIKNNSGNLLQRFGGGQATLPSEGRAPSKAAIWRPKKCAEIKVNHEEIGFLGEISPRILEDLKISMRLVIFDFDFEKLTKLASEEHEYRPISRFPAAIRDLAVLVPPETRVEEVLNKVEALGGPLIRDIDLFDIYEGEELPERKKNLAFHIIYQAEDRTLSSKEIDEIHNKIIKKLEEEPEWQVRK